MLLAAVLASLIYRLESGMQPAAGLATGCWLCCARCSISSSCVNQTRRDLPSGACGRWCLEKFIPGFATVAPPVAGALGMAPSSFFMASALGAGLWAGMALLAGYAFQAEIDSALADDDSATWR